MILPNQVKNHQSIRLRNIGMTKNKLEELYKEKKRINKKWFITEIMSILGTTDRTAKEYLMIALHQMGIGEDVVFEKDFDIDKISTGTPISKRNKRNKRNKRIANGTKIQV